MSEEEQLSANEEERFATILEEFRNGLDDLIIYAGRIPAFVGDDARVAIHMAALRETNMPSPMLIGLLALAIERLANP